MSINTISTYRRRGRQTDRHTVRTEIA
jgi:hypothetical protein